MSQELKPALLARAAQPRRDRQRDRLHAHEASRQPPVRELREGRRSPSRASTATASQAQRTDALEGFKSGATACSSPRTSPRAASTSRRWRTSSTSTCRRCPRTTSIASAGPRAPSSRARRITFVVAGGGERPARDRARHRQAPAARHCSPTSTTRSGRRSSFEMPIGERIAAIRSGRRTIARAPRRSWSGEMAGRLGEQHSARRGRTPRAGPRPRPEGTGRARAAVRRRPAAGGGRRSGSGHGGRGQGGSGRGGGQSSRG